jgi:adenylate cyclase
LSVLWHGTRTTKLRIASGLVMFIYVFFHLINVGLGLFSAEWMEAMQHTRQWVSRSLPGSILLYAALLTHAGLALASLASRRTLKMSPALALQSLLGVVIPLMLITHIIFTRVSYQVYGTDDEMSYVAALLWGTVNGWEQALMVMVVWVHGCIGLHYWLRQLTWWQRAQPLLIGIAVLIPGFALAGFMTEGRRMQAAFADPATRATLMDQFNWPSDQTFAELLELNTRALWMVLGLLALVALAYVLRKLRPGPNTVRIRYVNGPDVTSPRGPTLLEISQANGVAHTALCGGRGRCTTCRVVIDEGAEKLHPPSAAETRALEAVNAPPGARLACQIRPTDPTTVFRVFRPDGRRGRAHASQGQERDLAVMFLDMRGFTARTAGQLPYDVVFLLNRFFDAIVPSITGVGGTVDKYLGDGLMAVFETADEASSARAALNAAVGIGSALTTFNRALAAERAPPVAIGIGIHLGDVVLGEIGAAGNAPRTLIGDTVNTASRLEGKTKELGVQLLISESVLKSAGIDTGGLNLIELELRGLTHPLPTLALKTSDELATLLQRPTATMVPARAG